MLAFDRSLRNAVRRSEPFRESARCATADSIGRELVGIG